MKKLLPQLICLLFFPLALLLNYLFSLNPHIGESFYSLRLNKIFIQGLSRLTGIFPFSLFELMLYFFILFYSFYLLHTLWQFFSKKHSWKSLLLKFISNHLALFSILYFVFTSMWGLNYLRPPFGKERGIEASKHTTAELAELYSYLINELNSLSAQTPRNTEGYMTVEGGYKGAFERASLGYLEASKWFPSLSGNYGPPKAIWASELMNYTGITGIYSPFTGEANVNVAVLDLFIPATTLHEMAHQRGFANEDEADFISFLTCIFHPDMDFKYSGYLLALAHTNTALAKDDISLLRELNLNLSPDVLNDIRHNNTFWAQYEGEVEKISSKVNDTYLKANGVSDGQKSYGRMVDLLLSYYTLSIKSETSFN
jgi:hypothetical protein